MTAEPIVEGFAIETVEHLIFSVKGVQQPPERVIAYLRYLPDPGGDRRREGLTFRRVYHFEEQVRLLRSRYPAYLCYDPVLGLEVQSVPRARISIVHDPRAYLDRLRRKGSDDPVEQDALALAQHLQQAAGVPWSSLGISGSVMLATHRPDSDLDLLIYGPANSKALYRALAELFEEAAGPVRQLTVDELRALHATHRPDTPLSFHDFCRAQRRKVNEGRFRQRPFFVRFVKQLRPQECYGERRYQFVGRATLQATVCEDSDAIFTPCRYGLEHVTWLEGPPVEDLREIVSFRGRFSDQVRAGEVAQACGNVERVVSNSDQAYHRLVVGGQVGDYLLTVEGGRAGHS